MLLEKKKDGSLKPWEFQGRHKDGSLRVDIPLESLHLVRFLPHSICLPADEAVRSTPPVLQRRLVRSQLSHLRASQLTLSSSSYKLHRLPSQPSHPPLLLPTPRCARPTGGSPSGQRLARRLLPVGFGTVFEDRIEEELSGARHAAPGFEVYAAELAWMAVAQVMRDLELMPQLAGQVGFGIRSNLGLSLTRGLLAGLFGYLPTEVRGQFDDMAAQSSVGLVRLCGFERHPPYRIAELRRAGSAS